MSKTLEGMARASVDADGCDGDYDKNPPEIRDALATDMKRALLWLADNVSDEMLEAFNKAKGITRRVAWEDGQAILAISAALRAAAGEVAAFKKVAAASAALHQADTSEIAKLKAERDRLAGEVERVTKELDVSWAKRKIWINGFNEQSALAEAAEAERDRLKAALDIAKDHAKQNQRARDLVSPYPNDHAKRIVWEKALYHEGKGLWAKLRKALGDAS